MTDAQLRTERLTWATAEYASLREEAIVAQSNQQAAMHWGLAVVSGSLVGGFALSAKEGTPSLSVQNIQLILFGLVLPFLLLAISLVWLGEFKRMARAGAYLRLVEEHVYRQDQRDAVALGIPPDTPLGWETALAGGNIRFPARFRRNYLGYAGTGMILAGGQLASGIIWSIFQHEYNLTLGNLPLWLTWVSVWALVGTTIVLQASFAWRAIQPTIVTSPAVI